MKLGYCRVSTKDQNLAQQRDALRKAGSEKIFEDVASGAKEDREQLAKLLEHAREGDVIVVWKLDRLARSIRHLIRLADELKARDIHFHSLTDAIDTSTASGELHFHMLAALAQFERGLIRERVLAGLERARAEGKKSGRKPADHPDKISALATAKELHRQGMTITAAAKKAGIARTTVYKYLGEEKTDTGKNGHKKRTNSTRQPATAA